MDEKTEILLEQLKDPDESVKKYAIQDIADLDDPSLAPYLLPLLKDSSIAVSEAAIEALSAIGSADTCLALIELLAEENVHLRNSACIILQNIGVKNLTLIFSHGLESPVIDIRKFAVDILSQIRGLDPETAEQVAIRLGFMLDDENENVAIAAAEALGRLKVSSSLHYLKDALSKSGWIQFASIQAISYFETQEAKKLLETLDQSRLDPWAREILNITIRNTESA